ncbi:pyridoxamine 5'-phosphate oxidase family protein [bacterium]|nr:pyridoxamine 5'-phosphate oxidase family protein [bacterium]
MSKAFTNITFTPAVRDWQERNGSRQSYQRFEQGPLTGDRLGPVEQDFVRSIDGFYQATVASNGWPYVQFRGGKPGFLRVLDEQTLGYADLRGNKQFLSMGNLSTDDRVMLFLMDYENQERLKIWGRARISQDPGLVEKLAGLQATGKAERAVLIHMEAYDWNCSQHIPQRITLQAK